MDKQSVIEFNVKPVCDDIQEFKVAVSDYKELVGKPVEQLRYEPAVGAHKGGWELHYLGIVNNGQNP